MRPPPPQRRLNAALCVSASLRLCVSASLPLCLSLAVSLLTARSGRGACASRASRPFQGVGLRSWCLALLTWLRGGRSPAEPTCTRRRQLSTAVDCRAPGQLSCSASSCRTAPEPASRTPSCHTRQVPDALRSTHLRRASQIWSCLRPTARAPAGARTHVETCPQGWRRVTSALAVR